MVNKKVVKKRTVNIIIIGIVILLVIFLILKINQKSRIESCYKYPTTLAVEACLLQRSNSKITPTLIPTITPKVKLIDEASLQNITIDLKFKKGERDLFGNNLNILSGSILNKNIFSIKNIILVVKIYGYNDDIKKTEPLFVRYAKVSENIGPGMNRKIQELGLSTDKSFMTGLDIELNKLKEFTYSVHIESAEYLN